MKFRKIFQMEFTYGLRSITTWLYFLVQLVLSFLWMTGNYIHDARDGYFLANAPIVIGAVTVLGCVAWLLIGASVAGDAAARDVETRMYSLTYTAPASKFDFLGGRLLAALSLNSIVLFGIPLGILISLYGTGVEPEIMGPFRLSAYLTTFFYLILPNALIVTAIQFSFAALTRRPMASYLGGAILFVAAFILGQVLQDKGEWGNLIDPVGFTPIQSQLSNEWSPLEKNTRLLALEGTLLLNRLLWVAIAVGMLTLTYFRFRLVLLETGQKRKQAIHPETSVAGLKWSYGGRKALPQNRGMFSLATHLRQLRLLTWKGFLQIGKSFTGLPLLAALALFASLALDGNLKTKGVPLLPKTDHILNLLTASITEIDFFYLVIALLTIYYAGELVWRERETGLSEITHATPVPEWVLFLSKFLALGLVLVGWLVFLMTAAILAQLSRGGSPEIGLYLQGFFGLQLVDCLLFALLALFVHVLVNQKFVAHLVALLVYGFLLFAPNLGIEHKLLVYGASPKWSYTDMVGYGTSLAPWLWFKLYWVAWALLVAVAAKLLWVRSREGSIRARFQLARRRFTRSTALVTVVSVGLVLTLGSFIFYNTNVLNDYTASAEGIAERVEYEKRYRQYKDRPQPLLTRTKLHVEIYPERQEVGIRGTYFLVNNTNVTIDTVHLDTTPGVQTTKIAFDRPATKLLADEKLKHHIYGLHAPLKPGDSLQLSFAVHSKAQGFANSGADASVTANSSNFRNYEWLPAIGYQDYRELDDASSRKEYGLAPRSVPPSLYDVKARLAAPFDERVHVDAVVGTKGDQTVVGPGALRRTWTKGNRKYFHYVTDAPIKNEYNFFSARYAVHEKRWKDVLIQIYYNPGQTENLERMARSVQASLEYYTQQFGPYPHRQIRFVSYPGYDFGNHAAPINITAQEGFFILDTKNDERGFDLVTAVVAHEVAHQWWGNQVDPALVEGSGLLSESLAWYSAMGVLEEHYGPAHLHKLLSFLREEYETPRTKASVPLLQAADWYHNYRKGPMVLYALSRYMGKDRVNAALQSLLKKHALGKPPFPTSLDLYQELKGATPDSLQPLLHDFFEKNTFWDLKTKQATAKQTNAGTWQVMLKVQSRKFAVDSIGVEAKLPIKDWVEIGIYAKAKEGEALGKTLYLQKHLITTASQTITMTVPAKPVKAGIDPNFLLVDWELKDNLMEVTLAEKPSDTPKKDSGIKFH
ncbi:ABC transporter permease [Rufibacter radiotolerans]|uniref:ABC transporter permease n=1 Tax=Rufibacter radiotolerans TaxID=1379910 RepID=A0A0H4VMQ9_9BACT|nr:M1 family aminopeptidase [Rufibacter radiotolerans]AKQ47180.1 ABC transporter permease [Rufibacter radiotolerans]